jgi:hypothetical protein
MGSFSQPLLLQQPVISTGPKRTRPRSWTRVLWTFFLPVTAVSLDVFDCVGDPLYSAGPQYMRSIPSIMCSGDDHNYLIMKVLALVAMFGYVVLFPLQFLWVSLRKRAASTSLDPGDRWGPLRTRLWILFWHACRLSVAFVVFIRATETRAG